MFALVPLYSREKEKLRQQAAFISPPAEAGVFCGNMINGLADQAGHNDNKQYCQKLLNCVVAVSAHAVRPLIMRKLPFCINADGPL